MILEQCKAACLHQERCRGFVFARTPAGQLGPCFLRADIDLDKCEANNSYVMWFMGTRGNSTTEATSTPSTSGAPTQETAGSSSSINTDGFAKLQTGSCTDVGLVAISGRAICELAASSLGLADTGASTTQVAERPEGCYYSPGHGQRLWMGMNPQSKGRGAETSIPGIPRYPICATVQALRRITAETMRNAEAKFELRPASTAQAAPYSWSLGSLRMGMARSLGLLGLIGLAMLVLSSMRASMPLLPQYGARQADHTRLLK